MCVFKNLILDSVETRAEIAEKELEVQKEKNKAESYAGDLAEITRMGYKANEVRDAMKQVWNFDVDKDGRISATVVHLDADGRRRHQSGPPRQAPRCDRRAERVPPLRHVREMDVPGRRCMKQLLFALKQKDSRYGGLTVTTLTSLNGSPTRARARRPAPASKESKPRRQWPRPNNDRNSSPLRATPLSPYARPPRPTSPPRPTI